MKRIAAVVTLALLSPLIAEYLSGSLSFAQFGAMPVMLAMYGGGVVLIRELVRRAGRGWPSILLLGLAYALIEEGIADQSLFNPNFLGLHLLAPGFIPVLGIGVPWTIYVLAIHVIWSIAVPIALVESLFPSLANQPFLGRIGTVIAALIYACGVVLITLYFATKFFASPNQIAASVIAVGILAVVAFALSRPAPKRPGVVPAAWSVGIASLVATSALVQVFGLGGKHLPWQAVAGGMIAILVLMLSLGVVAGRRAGWSRVHICAAAAGALLTYCWTGFFSEIALHGRAMLPAHAGLATAMIGLVVLASVRAARSSA